MSSRGKDNLVENLKRGCLSPEVLTLKVGARVMFTKNDVQHRSYVNGTLGVVTILQPTGTRS
jgi:ATP-dependent DNA helicase PIF1